MRDRVIVVGAGIGGLTAALRLAHEGLDVTVLDRLSHVGGKMRGVESPAGPVDAGPTVLTLRDVFETLFDDVGEGLDSHVSLVAEPVLARHWWSDGSALDLHADPDATEAALLDFSGPEAVAGFRAFHRVTARLFAAFDPTMMRDPDPKLSRLAGAFLRDPGLLGVVRPGRTLAAMLARHFRDPRLRQLFGRYATYVGGSPFESPALLALIWQAEARGVWRVAGGMHRLARAIAALAERRGARFRPNTEVARIETRAGRVSAVHLVDGERIPADMVLFNGDPRALRVGEVAGVAAAVSPAAVEPRSHSAWVWSFAGRPGGVDLRHHNVFFGAVPRSEFDDLARGEMPCDPTLYVCAQDRGVGESPRGPERFEIIVNAPPATRADPPDDREFDRCRDLTFARLSRMGLRFQDQPDRSALTTPRDFAGLFPASQGALYGLSPSGMTSALRRPRARTRIPGFYLAGGGAHPGPGVPMAALSGQFAAEAMLSDLASTSRSRRTAMPGGTSTEFRPTTSAPSRSSPS